jgi:hypothetical protein
MGVMTTKPIDVLSGLDSYVLIDGRESGNNFIRGLVSTRKEEIYKVMAGLLGMSNVTLLKSGNSKEGDIYPGFSKWEVPALNNSRALSITQSMSFSGQEPIDRALQYVLSSKREGVLSIITTEEWDLPKLDLSHFDGEILLIQVGDFHPPYLPPSNRIHLRTWGDVFSMQVRGIPLINWKAI